MYFVKIWGKPKETYLNPLIKLQKKSVRIFTHSHYHVIQKPCFPN